MTLLILTIISWLSIDIAIMGALMLQGHILNLKD